MLTYIHSPHTLGRILLPIIDDGCYFGEFIEELGRSRVPMVNKELAKRKGKKNEQKGGRRKAFFFWPSCFEVLDKSYNASYEHILSKYHLLFIGVIRKLFIRP